MTKSGTIHLSSGKRIGHGEPCFIVAEIGNNHQGEIALAREMVHSAKEAGVDAVKFQKRDMEALLTRAGREAPYTGANSFGPTYGEHRLALELDMDQMYELKELAESLGLVFFASCWDLPSLEQVMAMEVELLKICSADLVNVPLLRAAARSRIPAILSTGMSSIEDIDVAVEELARHGSKLVLLHCNSTYPCPEEQLALPVIESLRERYGLPVGYSGHERGIAPSVASVALGACVIERHFTLDREMKGTDHKASLTPAEMGAMVAMVREVEGAMTAKGKRVCPEEQSAAKKLRKSIVFSRDLPAGHVLTEADLTTRSPWVGVSPIHWDEVLGSTLKCAVKHEEPLQWDMVSLAPARESVTAASS